MFKSGKLTFVMDIGAGSSAKGIRAANLWKHYKKNHTTFVVNTYLENAAHSYEDDNHEYIFQCLSSITPLDDLYEKQYLSPGCAFQKETILKEITDWNMTPEKLGIHPNAIIVTKKDIDYEAGRTDFEGNQKHDRDSANLRIGSTLHGVGAARARRVLRRSDVVLAKDIPELQQYLCATNKEIMSRLNGGESGLHEIAQGYQLSLMSEFYPRTTSRNVSVSAALDDSLLPPNVVGPLIANFRTFPIRVNSNKYIRKSDGKILTWNEYKETNQDNIEIIKGDSGGCYSDQSELTWEYISSLAGRQILETTSLTKLPRRVYSFSKNNMNEGLLFNNTGDNIYISVNFMNYVDPSVEGKRTLNEVLTDKVKNWINSNILTSTNRDYWLLNNINVRGIFIGTFKTVDDSVFVPIANQI